MNAPHAVGELDRTTYLGGSDVAAILGISPWTTPFQLFQKKTGALVEEITPAKERLFARGRRWEPIVLEMVVDELQERGHDVQVIATGQRYTDPEHSFLAAEIDAELMVDGELVNGEMKTANVFAADGWGARDSDDVPIYYLAQVMHGLMIQPRRRAVIAALTGFDDRPMLRWVERDEETIAAIRAKEIAFWQRVQSGDAPDPTTAEDVKWLYRQDGGTTLEADDDLVSDVAALRMLKSSAKELEAEIELLATRIKLQMGSNAVLLGPNGKPIATWKNNKAGQKTDWQAVAIALGAPRELIASHTKTTAGARPFNLK